LLLPLLRFVAARRPGCIFMAETAAPVVALTIDDGPDPRTTPRLLALLERHDARATFFLISGRVPDREDVVRAIVRGGHEVGNHLTRDEPSVRLSAAAFEAALLEAHRVLSPFAPLRWARPGSGWYTAEMVATMRRHGYRCALGSIYPFDPHHAWPAASARVILRAVHPGAIIILHDGGARGERTARVLERVLPELAGRGYRVVTLTELFEG
jgi:peptidoglycan-N-acetylglucosamine deacetylase